MTNKAKIFTRDGTKLIHRFRSTIRSMCTVNDRLIVLTDQGVYQMDKNGKRFRKIKPRFVS